jgi:hypothetical protein
MRQYDENMAVELGALPWQLELVKLNPSYVYWGPYEDYMIKKDGWDSAQFFSNWNAFGPWELNELNECVNFYFQIERKKEECPTCAGEGYNVLAKDIVNSFYSHQCESVGLPRRMAWHDKITDDEAEVLVQFNRAPVGSTAESINAKQRTGGFDSHDAINRHILIKQRIKRELGIEPYCPVCNGDGTVYVEDFTTVSLTLWILHPRKGCSRGVEISNITQEDLGSVMEFLRTAAERNAERFQAVTKLFAINFQS